MKRIILIALVLFVAIPAVQATDLFYFGNFSYNYNAEEVPFYQYEIEQGAVVYQGRVYDIRGTIGTSDYIAHWKNWKEEDETCSPDIVIPVRYVISDGSVDPSNYFIDPSIMAPGNYFQWDGCRQYTVLEKQPDGSFKTITKEEQAPRENRFAFTVKAPQRSAVIQLVPTQIIPAYSLPEYALPKGYAEVSEEIVVSSTPEKKEDPWYITYWWALVIVAILLFIFREDLMDLVDDIV